MKNKKVLTLLNCSYAKYLFPIDRRKRRHKVCTTPEITQVGTARRSNYDWEPPWSSICPPIKLSDDYHTSDRIPGIFIHLSFSSQHWDPTFLPSSLFLSCAHSHLSSSFFSSIISLPKLSSFPWKRSREPLIHLRFLARKCHYIVHLIHHGHAIQFFFL